jgi:uncharacterized protein (DUF305 family)
MLERNPGRVAMTLLVVITAAACGTGSAQTKTAPVPDAQLEWRVVHGDTAAIRRAREDSVKLPYTKADVDFMAGMIHHHAQAIEMARLAPTHGASRSIQTLAGRVINAQQDEIMLMQQWLADRLQQVPDPGAHGHQHHMMPGMLTADQMKQLDKARGKEFDRLFLELMIQHHAGAVTMVEKLFGTTGAGQNHTVFKLASDVNADQTTEIARMEQMLDALKP